MVEPGLRLCHPTQAFSGLFMRFQHHESCCLASSRCCMSVPTEAFTDGAGRSLLAHLGGALLIREALRRKACFLSLRPPSYCRDLRSFSASLGPIPGLLWLQPLGSHRGVPRSSASYVWCAKWQCHVAGGIPQPLAASVSLPVTALAVVMT